MKIFPQNRLTIKEIWLTALSLYRKTFLKTWHLGMFIGTAFTTFLLVETIYNAKTFETKLIIACTLLIVPLIITYLASLILYQVHSTGNGHNWPLTDLTKMINKKYFKVLVSTFLVFALFFVGRLLFVLPGIFVLVLFVMVQPLVLLDDHGVFAALKGSCKLIWGNWWRTFAVIFPVILVNYWLSFIIKYVYAENIWCIGASNILLSILFFPLFYSCVLVTFNDLKLRKQVFDVAMP